MAERWLGCGGCGRQGCGQAGGSRPRGAAPRLERAVGTHTHTHTTTATTTATPDVDAHTRRCAHAHRHTDTRADTHAQMHTQRATHTHRHTRARGQRGRTLRLERADEHVELCQAHVPVVVLVKLFEHLQPRNLGFVAGAEDVGSARPQHVVREHAFHRVVARRPAPPIIVVGGTHTHVRARHHLPRRTAPDRSGRGRGVGHAAAAGPM